MRLTLVLLAFTVHFLANQAFAAFEGLRRPDFPLMKAKSGLKGENANHNAYLVRNSRFGIPELAVIHGRMSKTFSSGSKPMTVHKIGINWFSTGDDLYKETLISAGFGIERSKIGAEVWGDIYNLYIKNYGNATALGTSLTAYYLPHQSITFIATINNLVLKPLRKGSKDIRYSIGSNLFWAVGPMTTVCLSVDYYESYNVEFKCGISESFRDSFEIRVWLGDNPQSFGCGLNIPVHHFSIILGTSVEVPLGWSNQAGIGFQW